MVNRIPASGNRLREVRQRVGLTMDQLGEKAGVHFTTVAKIERSQRRLSGDLLLKFANALGVPVADLVEGVPETLPVRMVPIVGKIAAGNWREAVAEAEGGYIPIPIGGPNAFALQPDGDSMDLAVGPASFVIFDPDEQDLLDGSLYAVMNAEGETTFKRFRAQPPRLEPVSSNPIHQAIPLGREPFTVIGRAVGQFAYF